MLGIVVEPLVEINVIHGGQVEEDDGLDALRPEVLLEADQRRIADAGKQLLGRLGTDRASVVLHGTHPMDRRTYPVTALRSVRNAGCGDSSHIFVALLVIEAHLDHFPRCRFSRRFEITCPLLMTRVHILNHLGDFVQVAGAEKFLLAFLQLP